MHHSPGRGTGVTWQKSSNSATCGQIGQLEVCQLLTSGLQVIYPMGLNGHEAPMIVLPPKSLARGTTLIGGKLSYLVVGILQPTPEGQRTQSTTPWQSLLLHPNAKCHQGSSAKGGKRGQHDNGSEGTSIIGSIRHVWTSVRKLNPKGLNAMVVLTPLPPKWGIFWSSGHILLGEHPRWCQDGEASLEEVPTSPLPIAKTPGPNSGTPTKDADHLQKETNKV